MLNRVFHSVKVFFPHLFLLGLIFLCLGLREASPRVVAITEEIPANGSFLVTFNKPFRIEGLEEKFAVLKNGERIPGTLRKTATSLVFSPERPWESGQGYQVRIESLPAERGDVVTEPIEHSFKIQKERFLYLDLSNRLMEGDPETGTTEPVTPEDIEILSFSTGTDGHLVALYGLREDKYRNGILLGKKQGDRYSLTIFPAVETPRYSQALLCNDSRALLIVSQEKSSNPSVQYFMIDWEQSSHKKLFQDWEVKDAALYSEGDIACSEDTTRVLYRKLSGVFVANFLGEASEDLVGVFDTAVGFSPRSTSMLFQKSITETSDAAAYRSELSIYQSDGTSVTLSAPNTLFREASFNGNGTALSLLYTDGESYGTRIETYVPDRSTWIKNETVYPPRKKHITHHALSLDSNLLALEVEPEEMTTQISTDTPKIILWDSEKKQNLSFEWEGRRPQWEK